MAEDTDEVKAFVKRSLPPLAELRQKTLEEIQLIKEGIAPYVQGVVIGISPTDKMLNDHTRGEITNYITNIFKRIRIRDETGVLVPVHPLSALLVGEYSNKHRWHYHGWLKVDNIKILEAIKKKLRSKVGRTITESVGNAVYYTNYMFKQYECPDHGYYYQWDNKECIVRVDK